jgi:hypothetical protein
MRGVPLPHGALPVRGGVTTPIVPPFAPTTRAPALAGRLGRWRIGRARGSWRPLPPAILPPGSPFSRGWNPAPHRATRSASWTGCRCMGASTRGCGTGATRASPSCRCPRLRPGFTSSTGSRRSAASEPALVAPASGRTTSTSTTPATLVSALGIDSRRPSSGVARPGRGVRSSARTSIEFEERRT